MDALTKPGEEEKKPTSEELDKAKVSGDQIDKKPDKPTEEDITTPKTDLDTLIKPGEEDKKPTTDELDKTKVDRDGIVKKPEEKQLKKKGIYKKFN